MAMQICKVYLFRGVIEILTEILFDFVLQVCRAYLLQGRTPVVR